MKSTLSNFEGSICEYFGVKIALYFAWLGHYTTALLIPAVVGIVFWVSYDLLIIIVRPYNVYYTVDYIQLKTQIFISRFSSVAKMNSLKILVS